MLTLLILLVLAGIAVLIATYKYWRVHWKKIGAGLAAVLLLGGASLLFPTPEAVIWHSASFGGSALVELSPPTSLTALSHNETCLNVSFDGVVLSAYRTMIERNATAVTAWALGAGTEVYNATGSTDGYVLDYPLSNGVTYYYQAWCRNETTEDWSADNTSANGTPEAYDTTPPTPSPLTWIAEPVAVSTTEISMECTDAADASEPIYYYFNETTGHAGGSDSGAQNEVMTYTDDQLEENLDYTYFCRAKDSNATPNWGAASTPSVTKYTWAAPPLNTEISSTSYGTTWINISVAQCANADGGNTDCYIDCESGHDDATYALTVWTTDGDDRWYFNFTGLTISTQYGFKAKYRNGDSIETTLNPDWQYWTTLSGTTTTWHSAPFGGSVAVTEPGSGVTWHSRTFGGSATVSESSWSNWSAFWRMESKSSSTSVISTDGIDYFVWVGANVSAFHVMENISDVGVTWSAGEYIALWNNDTWSASRALWNWSMGTNPGANNWTVHTFDVVKTYVTDDIGEITMDITNNPDIVFTNPRNIACTATGSGASGNRGYNFVAYTPGTSDLRTVSETNLGQITGEWVSLWDDNWYFWIAHVSPDSYNKDVLQYSVLQIKVTATRYLNMF